MVNEITGADGDYIHVHTDMSKFITYVTVVIDSDDMFNLNAFCAATATGVDAETAIANHERWTERMRSYPRKLPFKD